MQNNQSPLFQHFLSDFNHQYQAEAYRNQKKVDLDEYLNVIKDDFNQNYGDSNSQIQNLDNFSLNPSEPYINSNSDREEYENTDRFLDKSIDSVDYHTGNDYYLVDENEIHYLNFIKKSEIAVSRQKYLESNRYGDYQEEENLKTYRIVCIDDSRAVVNAIKMYLDNKMFSVVGINDPLKALMQIIRLKPDLILLDISMPTLDGYELCSLLRKHSSLKETPIIMVTGRKGIINRVKAKMVKASDYLTKPFQKKDLLKIIFKYIV